MSTETTPQPDRFEVVDGSHLLISWSDGTTTSITASALRAACQCAGCREEAGRQQTDLVVNGPVPITISDAHLVGGYAVSFVFGPDGHGTGIYPFELLSELGAPPDASS